MKVYGLVIPNCKGLTNFDLDKHARTLRIPNFRGVFMRDTLPSIPYHKECGIVNFDTSKQVGSHWVCYFKDEMDQRIYFDSFGQITPIEIQRYLKTDIELKNDIPAIERNTDIVQRSNTHVCGHLCLFVLTSLMREHLSYQHVLNILKDGYSQGDW